MSMARVEWVKSMTAWVGARDVTRSHRGAGQTEDFYPELFPKDFGERLERLTEVADLSWGEFAERLGIDEDRVIERRKGAIPTGGGVWHIKCLARSVPGGIEVMLQRPPNTTGGRSSDKVPRQQRVYRIEQPVTPLAVLACVLGNCPATPP